MMEKTVTIEVTITKEAAKNLFDATVRSGVSDLPNVSIQDVLSALLCRPFFADLLIRMSSIRVDKRDIGDIDMRIRIIGKSIKSEYLSERLNLLNDTQRAEFERLFPI